jgi:hypothetical protein
LFLSHTGLRALFIAANQAEFLQANLSSSASRSGWLKRPTRRLIVAADKKLAQAES